MPTKKDCMFQYATLHKVIKDTGLITKDEAEALWKEYQEDIRDRWNEFEAPQMGIWIDCDSITDYHTIEKEIDYRDCELENGHFYKVEKKRVA